jgi:hypothetical protein
MTRNRPRITTWGSENERLNQSFSNSIRGPPA